MLAKYFFGLLVGKNMRLSNLNSAQAEVFVTAKKPTELRDFKPRPISSL